MQFLVQLLTCLDLKTTSWSLFSDGALCFTPWADVIESIRIRTVPSLTSYQLMSSVSEGHHKKTGALLVGNPCLNQLEKPLPDLPCTQEKVEIIGSILNTRPLTRRQATKAEVMKRMSSVGLIHICCPRKPSHWRNCFDSKPWMDCKVPSKKGLQFENVRFTSGQSSSSSCGLKLLSQWTKHNLQE